MPRKVLLVDDEPLMHLLYKKHLEQAGYQMLTAKDGSEVLEIARSESPELIVMDVVMTRMNGLEALRAVKSDTATKGIPVIIVTGQGVTYHSMRQEAEGAGAALFLTKPFSPAQLIAAVQKVLPVSGTPGAAAAAQQ